MTAWWYANPTEFQKKFMAMFYPEITEYKAYRYKGSKDETVYAFFMFKGTLETRGERDGKPFVEVIPALWDNSVQMYEKDYQEAIESGKFREIISGNIREVDNNGRGTVEQDQPA